MRKLTYTTDFGGDYCEVSIDLLEEESEKILGIRIGSMRPFYLRSDDIDELHDKIHECIEAHATFAKLAAQGMGGWNDQAEHDEEESDEEESEPLSGMARGMLWQLSRGYRVQDNLEGGICRLTGALATMPEKHLEELQAHRFVQILKQDELNSRCTWGISVEGAAYLAEQEG